MKTKKQKIIEEKQNEKFYFQRDILNLLCPKPNYITEENINDYIKLTFKSYIENVENKELIFRITSNFSSDINFEFLYDLATLLKTKKINFSEDRVQWGYSEYTKGTDIFHNFCCYEVGFPND